MTDTQTETTVDRSRELQDEYSQKLDAFTNELLPPTLANDEYAARTSALMIALNRQLGRCAAAFGDVWQVDPDNMEALVFGQFRKNFAISRSALDGEGSAVH